MIYLRIESKIPLLDTMGSPPKIVGEEVNSEKSGGAKRWVRQRVWRIAKLPKFSFSKLFYQGAGKTVFY